MQYHFVVMYDDETNEFAVDYDTQEAKFHDCPIYNTKTDEWLELTGEHIDNDDSTYNKAADTLYNTVQYLQLKEK